MLANLTLLLFSLAAIGVATIGIYIVYAVAHLPLYFMRRK